VSKYSSTNKDHRSVDAVRTSAHESIIEDDYQADFNEDIEASVGVSGSKGKEALNGKKFL
jgi:hypothetical protein